MCGIAGVYEPISGKTIDKEILIRMRDSMVHRGPAGAGIWYSANRACGLAHRRLSILDLSDAAHQPMLNHSQDVALVFNGEIYNHEELRKELSTLGNYQWVSDHSDTEVLLNAYLEWGLECLHKLDGMFAFAIYDARDPNNQVLHLARDRVGKKPLYLSKTNAGEWIFASEIRALMQHPTMTPELDKTALWHYLTFIVAPAPLTMFKGVFKIPAGWFVSINCKGQATASEYWDCPPGDSKNTVSENELIGELSSLLKKSIKKRMVSDVPFGVLLSGGIDSSLNVALMAEQMNRPVSTFTIGYEGEENSNEFEYARRISKRYKTEHHEKIINKNDAQNFISTLVEIQDEPIADNVCIPLYFLSELVKSTGTTVVQVGEGADENFLGYWWCNHLKEKESFYNQSIQNIRPSLVSLFKMATKSIAKMSNEDLDIFKRAKNKEELFWGGAACWWGEMRTMLTPDKSKFIENVLCPVEGLLPESFTLLDSHNVVKHYINKMSVNGESYDVLKKIPYLEMKIRLPEHLLMRVDKMTMAHSIEARAPFLDIDLLNFANRLPSELKIKDGIGKYLLKKAAEPYLDHDMIYRVKQGFGAPMEKWFQNPEFGKKCLDAWNKSEIRKLGLIDENYFLDLLNKQISGKGGYSFHLWTVLNAVLWHESWVMGNKDCF